ncbi:MAG: Cof-type HAD-IIB family hydrolase [Candidatus Acidiferrales bacterium]
MPIRLIAIDIDGTLLDSRWQLPEANRKAIVEATERGVEVALVTGRRFDFAMPIASEIPCALTMIVNNGALIKSKDGATHLRNLLPVDVARRVLLDTLAYRAGAAVVFDRPCENQVIWEYMDWDDPGRRSYFERNREYLAQMAPLEACLTEDPIQVMFTGPVTPMRALAGELARLAYASEFGTAITEYEARNFSLVDVMQPGCSKGASLAAWAGRRGVARDEVLAIGDNLNDREMLEFAGVPVVMSNSVAELKSNGWHVTLSNDEAGVAAAIDQFVLRAGSLT